MRGRGVKAWIEVVVGTFPPVFLPVLQIQTDDLAGGVETSSGRDMFKEPLLGIECLEISGKA